MKLKTVEVNGKTYAEVQDNKPVFIEDDGKEVAFDALHSRNTITRLNTEAKQHRERAEAAEGKAKLFEGIEDPEAAKKAIETVKNLDQGQLVTAGKVEEIKKAAQKAAEDQVAAAAKASNEKIQELSSKLGASQNELYSEKVGGAFSRSKFIADKIAVPTDMVQAMFGQRFKVEEGKIIGVGLDGQPIYSRAKAGEIATFDEALESMVDAYPNRDSIIKGTGNKGDGARHSNGGGANGAKTITRSDFAALDPNAQMAKVKEGVAVVD